MAQTEGTDAVEKGAQSLEDSIACRRDVTRYRVSDDRRLKAALVVPDLGTIPVTVVDVSPVGARVVPDVPLTVETKVELRLECRQLELETKMAAEVRWCSPRTDGWHVGLSLLEHRLPDEFFDILAGGGIIDRRQSARLPVVITGSLKREGRTDATRIDVIDVSRDGLCVLSPVEAPLGGALLLTFDTPQAEPVSVVGTVKWREKQDDGYRLGLQIPSIQLQPMLRACGVAGLDLRPRGKRRMSLMTWLVAAVCAAAIATIAFLPPQQRAARVHHVMRNGKRMLGGAINWCRNKVQDVRRAVR